MQKLILANWKSHKTQAEVAHWLNNFPGDSESRRKLSQLEIVLAPPYPFLALAREIIEERQLPIKLAVQDLSAFGSGAYTGEVAAFNLQDFGIEYAILGHSERRRYLAESSQLVADKVAEALKWKIKPILCLDKPYFSEQARFLTSEAMNNCLLAYEPVAAIGSGEAEAAGNLLAIRQELTPLYSAKALIYGGSVNAENVGEYLRVSDGVLLGGASLKLDDFVDLLYAAIKRLS
jgi:triosephosphate isomerase (TIM)